MFFGSSARAKKNKCSSVLLVVPGGNEASRRRRKMQQQCKNWTDAEMDAMDKALLDSPLSSSPRSKPALSTIPVAGRSQVCDSSMT